MSLDEFAHANVDGKESKHGALGLSMKTYDDKCPCS